MRGKQSQFDQFELASFEARNTFDNFHKKMYYANSIKYYYYLLLTIVCIGVVVCKKKCTDSITTVNGMKFPCRGRLIFEDQFEQILGDDFASENHYRYLNSSVWRREIKIPLEPDYEFCVYHKLEKGLKVENGKLKIIPSLLDDSYGDNVTYFGRLRLADCNIDDVRAPGECFRQAAAYNILPPIISTRLITKSSFDFRYGKIEIRAKFPEGDWLYPELWLQPKYTTYGTGYSSGRVILGMARGNENLVKINDNSKDYGSSQLEFSIRSGTNGNITERKVMKKHESGTWTESYHVYTTVWNISGFTFMVDGEEIGKIPPNDQNNMAPFDLEFYISLGVGVGGIRVFPDETRSGHYEKPWKNVGAKAMLRFWQTKDQWYPSWLRENSRKISLEVDYVRVWSV